MRKKANTFMNKNINDEKNLNRFSERQNDKRK